MADTDRAPGWRVPGEPVQYLATFVILATELVVFFSIDFGLGRGRMSWIWGLLTASLITIGACFNDRKIRVALRGRTDAEAQAVRRSLRTGVLPPDGSFDAYIEWVIQLIGYRSHLLGRAQTWLPAVFAVCSLAAALVTGEALWLPIAITAAGHALLARWDLARMDACFASLERQITTRASA